MPTPASKHQNASERDASGDIDLAEGEKILYVTSRHWVVLLQRALLPLVCALVCGLIGFYRAIGGSFLLDAAAAPGEVDIVNTLLAIGFAAILIVWFFSRRRKAKISLSRQVLSLLLAVGIGGLFWFRYQGGRLFSVNPYTATPVDGTNIVLFTVTTFFVLLCIYVFIDWSNDQMVITNQRVIIDDEVFLIRHVQDQVGLDDIQNVTASTETYTQHWLNYGSVVIRSATAGRKMVFHAANKPLETQDRINGELKRLRTQQSAAQFRSMVEQKVYSIKPEKPRPALRIEERPLPILLRWVLECNPQIVSDKGTITWRPHWLFLLKALAQPIGGLIIALFVILLTSRFSLLGGGWLLVASVAVVVGFTFWAAWEIEDYRNDAYVLEPDKIIDVQKRPFGPEDRRTAGLGPVQNVNFKVTFWSGLLGYGDVLVETAGSGGAFTFPHVPNAPEVAATINDYLAAFKKGEKERNLNDTLTLLQHYHSAQMARKEIQETQPQRSPGTATPLAQRPDGTP